MPRCPDLQVRDGRLRGEVPVMIDAGEDGQGWEDVAEELDDIFVGDADLWCRAACPIGPSAVTGEVRVTQVVILTPATC